MSVKYMVDKIAAFFDGCTNEAIPARPLTSRHFL